MQCPACHHKLTEVMLGAVAIDVCEGGCGGIWFDNAELAKVEQEHHAAPDILVRVQRRDATKPAGRRSMHCPRCETEVLEPKIPRLGSAIEFDRCPSCHGYWLAHGELEKLIAENRIATPPGKGKRIYVNLEVVRFIHTVKIKKLPTRPA
jgi:Zn-finger nucleic acid-binding protein